MSSEQAPNAAAAPTKPEEPSEHLNIKVTDGNNEVFFKIKRTTQLKKLMGAFCERQGKAPNSVRFLFDGTRVQGDDSPESVSRSIFNLSLFRSLSLSNFIRVFLSPRPLPSATSEWFAPIDAAEADKSR
jgi:small ubiquitin-related modifier